MGEFLLIAVPLLIAVGVLRRRLNPFAEIAYASLPAELRAEIERVHPRFAPRVTRLTKKGDVAVVDGDDNGEGLRIEAEFDPAGTLLELETERMRSKRTTGRVAPDVLPEAVTHEIHRVLGDALSHFAQTRVTTGTLGDEELFEMKGRDGDWKWEIAVSASGRLLEFEKERCRR